MRSVQSRANPIGRWPRLSVVSHLRRTCSAPPAQSGLVPSALLTTMTTRSIGHPSTTNPPGYPAEVGRVAAGPNLPSVTRLIGTTTALLSQTRRLASHQLPGPIEPGKWGGFGFFGGSSSGRCFRTPCSTALPQAGSGPRLSQDRADFGSKRVRFGPGSDRIFPGFCALFLEFFTFSFVFAFPPPLSLSLLVIGIGPLETAATTMNQGWTVGT